MSRRLALLAALCALLAAFPAAASARLPTGFVGMTSEDSFSYGGSYSAANMATMRSAGVTLLRQTFNWHDLELSPGNYDFSLTDRYVRSAADHGMTVLPVLFNVPDFRSSRPAGNHTRGIFPPRNPEDMANFAKLLVHRYGPRGSLWGPGVPYHPIHAWQVWNEPNFPFYWLRKPNARAYVKLLRAVGKGIKSVDRKAEIVLAGIPPTRVRGSISQLKFIKAVYKARGASAFDTMAINSYSRNDKT